MGYNKSKMEALSKFTKPSYDSDKELPEDVQKKLGGSDSTAANKMREEAWDKAGVYPKLKRFMGDAWAGDIRKKK